MGGASAKFAGAYSSGAPAANTSTTDVQIGYITVNTQATDANGIAKDMGSAVKKHAFASQIDPGLN
jgi:hypothetical protein